MGKFENQINHIEISSGSNREIYVRHLQTLLTLSSSWRNLSEDCNVNKNSINIAIRNWFDTSIKLHYSTILNEFNMQQNIMSLYQQQNDITAHLFSQFNALYMIA